MIVILVAVSAAGTMAIRDLIGNIWMRALVTGAGGAMVGLIIILGQRRNSTKEEYRLEPEKAGYRLFRGRNSLSLIFDVRSGE